MLFTVAKYLLLPPRVNPVDNDPCDCPPNAPRPPNPTPVVLAPNNPPGFEVLPALLKTELCKAVLLVVVLVHPLNDGIALVCVLVLAPKPKVRGFDV